MFELGLTGKRIGNRADQAVDTRQAGKLQVPVDRHEHAAGPLMFRTAGAHDDVAPAADQAYQGLVRHAEASRVLGVQLRAGLDHMT